MKTYGKALALMAAVAVLAVAVGAAAVLTGGGPKASSRFKILASFYPIYIIAENLAAGTDAAVDCMASPSTGCLHDYQLSPSDLVKLSQTDIFLTGGAGAEGFLGDVTARHPNLDIVDSSVGVTLLTESSGETNEHIWTSPAKYQQQVKNLRDGLAAADPGNAAKYRANADDYIKKVEIVQIRLLDAAAKLPYRGAVLFHDSLGYLSADLGLNVLASLQQGDETAISAADLTAACDKAKAAGAALILTDTQYDLPDSTFDSLRQMAQKSAVIRVDTGVRGTSDPDSWLNAMNETADQLQAIEN